VTDSSGATNTSTFTVVYTPPAASPDPSGGGGHHGGCGVTGMELVAILLLVDAIRRGALLASEFRFLRRG
jgi:hypothetical protein